MGKVKDFKNIKVHSIIDFKNKPHIIVDFNYENETVGLAKWQYTINFKSIRSAMTLNKEYSIPMIEILNCEVLLSRN